jgi:hypothetical protein
MKRSAGMVYFCAVLMILFLVGRLSGMAGLDADRVEKILMKNCVTCHGGENPRAGLILESGEWFANMVNVASEEKPGLKIVDPRWPANSYLLHKIAGKGIKGKRMPMENEPLPAEDEQTLRGWAMSLGPALNSGTDAPPPPAISRPAFWGGRLINLPTTRMLGRNRWQVLVAHRFHLPLSSGYESYFGLNGPASVMINFGFGFSQRLEMLFSHTNSENQFDLAARWLVLPGRAASSHPVALVLNAGAGVVTQNITGEKRFAPEHFKVNLQAALSYQMCSRISLLLVPSYSTHVNHHDPDPQAVLALGTGCKITVLKELALIGQWVPVLSGPRAAANGWGIGLEAKFGRHVFQVFFLNAIGLLADQYLPGGDLLLRKGDFRLGFNLFREF